MKLSAQSHTARGVAGPWQRSSIASLGSAGHLDLVQPELDREAETRVPDLGLGMFLSLSFLI